MSKPTRILLSSVAVAGVGLALIVIGWATLALTFTEPLLSGRGNATPQLVMIIIGLALLIVSSVSALVAGLTSRRRPKA